MFDIVRADLRKKSEWYYGSSNLKRVLRMLLSDGTSVTLLYRLCQFLRKWNMGFIALFVSKFNEFLNHVMIGRGASFGPGLVVLHTYGIVINGKVVAGKNLIIMNGVSLGEEKGKSPILGDNVFIGAGAKVIGGVRVGNNVSIGANAVVVKDVPDNVTVAGVPAVIVRRKS